MSDSTTVAYPHYRMRNTPIHNRHGFKEEINEHTRQRRSTEEFKAYLKETDPKTYAALEYFANKYPPKELTEEEREKINNTKLKALKMPKPSTIKRIWQKIKSWFTKQAEKPHHITIEDLTDAIDKSVQIKDAIDKINTANASLQPPTLNS